MGGPALAELVITVAGKAHRVACRDGEEDKLRQAAGLLDERARSVAALGPMGEARSLLLAGLLLADERIEAIARGNTQPDKALADSLLDELAERIDAVAAALEAAAAS